jgi:hypothetical protein
MDWKKFFKLLLRNTVIAVTLTTIVLGTFGFLVAGKEGVLNGVTWGFILGLISVPFLASAIYAKYWGDYAGRYGQWYVENKTEGEGD